MNQNLRVNKTKRLRTRTRFETEAKSNSEIAHLIWGQALLLNLFRVNLRINLCSLYVIAWLRFRHAIIWKKFRRSFVGLRGFIDVKYRILYARYTWLDIFHKEFLSFLSWKEFYTCVMSLLSSHFCPPSRVIVLSLVLKWVRVRSSGFVYSRLQVSVQIM